MSNIFIKLILAHRYRKTSLRFVKLGLRGARRQSFHAPLIIQLYVTENCNLRCAMCHSAQSREKHLRNSHGSNLDPLQIERMVREMKDFQPAYYITGGEPLIYKPLFKVIDTIKRNKSMVGLVTNGYRLKEVYKDIIDSKVDFVSVSLDGSSPDIHDKNRGVNGSFERAIAGIEKFIEYRGHSLFPRLKINTVIRRENIHDLVNVFWLNKRLGVDEMSLEHFCFYYDEIKERADEYSNKFDLGTEVIGCKIDGKNYLTADEIHDLKRNLATIKKLTRRHGIKCEIKPRIDDIEKYYLGEIPSRKSRCDSMFYNIKIRQSGDIEICQGVIVGNIYRNHLFNTWNSPKANHFREYIKKHNNAPACFRCLGLNYQFH